MFGLRRTLGAAAREIGKRNKMSVAHADVFMNEELGGLLSIRGHFNLNNSYFVEKHPKPTAIKTKSSNGIAMGHIAKDDMDTRVIKGKPVGVDDGDGNYGYVDAESLDSVVLKAKKQQKDGREFYEGYTKNGLFIEANYPCYQMVKKNGVKEKKECTRSYVQHVLTLDFILKHTFDEHEPLFDPQSFSYDANTKELTFKYIKGRVEGYDPTFKIHVDIKKGIQPDPRSKEEFPWLYDEAMIQIPDKYAHKVEGLGDLSSLRFVSFGVTKQEEPKTPFKPLMVQCNSQGVAISGDHDLMHSALPNTLPALAYMEYNSFNIEEAATFKYSVGLLNSQLRNALQEMGPEDPRRKDYEDLYVEDGTLLEEVFLHDEWFAQQGKMTVGIYLRNCKLNHAINSLNPLMRSPIKHGPEVFNPGSKYEPVEAMTIFYKGKKIMTHNEEEYVDFLLKADDGKLLQQWVIDVHPAYLTKSAHSKKWQEVVSIQIENGHGHCLRKDTLEEYYSIVGKIRPKLMQMVDSVAGPGLKMLAKMLPVSSEPAPKKSEKTSENSASTVKPKNNQP